MTDNGIHFDRNGKKIYLDEGKSYKKAKKELKDLQPIFDAINEAGNKKGKVDGKETELLNLLRGKLGKYISEDSMKKLVEDFQKSGKSIEEFLKDEAPKSGIVKEYPNPVGMIERILEEDAAKAEEKSVADGVKNDVAEFLAVVFSSVVLSGTFILLFGMEKNERQSLILKIKGRFCRA